MANTYTADSKLPAFGSAGNFRVAVGILTMTDGPGGVDLGFDSVYGGAVTAQTAVTGGFLVKWNTTSGNVHVYSCASADSFNLFALGR